jgi:hypothetical protein
VVWAFEDKGWWKAMMVVLESKGDPRRKGEVEGMIWRCVHGLRDFMVWQ